MVKEPKKPSELQNNPFFKELEPNSNTIYSVSFFGKKPRKQIYQENYQKNKEKKKAQQKERYQRQKELAQQTEREQLSKYYSAEAIKILISLKEYTELNPTKRQLWLDFNWTLQDCQKSFKEGFADIVMIMKLEEVAGKLVRDFWETAKKERQRGKSWNSLSEEEQERLIKYWGYEKTRVENDYLTEEERLEKQSQEYLKEIELAKFHEERGKIKCPCYQCGEQKKIRKEIQGKINKELKELEEKEAEKDKCNECGKIKELGEEGACKKCSGSYEN